MSLSGGSIHLAIRTWSNHLNTSGAGSNIYTMSVVISLNSSVSPEFHHQYIHGVAKTDHFSQKFYKNDDIVV